MSYALKVLLSALVILAVAEIAKRSTFWAAALASLPLPWLLRQGQTFWPRLGLFLSTHCHGSCRGERDPALAGQFDMSVFVLRRPC